MMVDDKYMVGDYLRNVYKPNKLDVIVRDAKKVIVDSGVQFDAIAFRGMSGAIVVPTLAIRMKTHMIVIRKGTLNAHTNHKVEGYLPLNLRYIIVDDCIETGSTLRTIIRNIDKVYSYQHRNATQIHSVNCVGIFIYNDKIRKRYLFRSPFFRKNLHGPVISLYD